ncbi:MAG: carbamoyl-phosphate synthase large subunit [Anaerophaga sp.]|nr:carbamoyl-phosphate synthase large subunit [Anaerophaga sp.]
MNILISSAGRQAYLVSAFKEALFNKGLVFVADNNKNAPALNVADGYYISPLYESKEYLPWLLDICKKNKINLLISLNVDELLILESQREPLKKIGCLLLGGDLEIIKMTYDKLALSKFSKSIGLDTPKIFSNEDIYSENNIVFPLIAKHRYGKGSRGQSIINSHDSLIDYIKKNEQKKAENEPYIFQQFINGDEYGLDIVNDFHSRYAGIFVRKKYSMKNGETFEAITQSKEGWEEIARTLSQNLKHQGSVDVDFIVQNNKKYLIDINHRFGGGYIFSHVAGANLPHTFINWLLNNAIDEKWLNPIPGIHSRRNGLGVEVI